MAGKVIGITGATALAVRLGLARLPDDVARVQLTDVAALAGIGFTVSLFITGLVFDQPGLQIAVRLAVLATSALGTVILLRHRRRRPPSPPVSGDDCLQFTPRAWRDR